MSKFRCGLVVACLLHFTGSLFASPHALIVTGLSGSTQNSEEFQKLASETKRLLVERGFAAENVDIASEKVTRQSVLEKLQASQTVDDEFWLVLYGHSGKSQGGEPAFQVSGPRLTAGDIKKALDAIPAQRQFVFIGTNDSGEFLPLLQNAKRTVVSATKAEGEGDQPRYPEKWVEAFSENPKASTAWIAARASALVSDTYQSLSLAQIEHARLADPVTGKILEPPFGVDFAAPAETAKGPSSGASSLITASDIHVKTQDPNAIWEHQPATDETKRLIAEAKAVPNPEGYSSVILEQKLGLTVEDDRTSDKLTFFRVYISKEDAVQRWANHLLPQSPPMVTTKLEVARVIQPDGSSIVFNPSKLVDPSDPNLEVCCPMTMVYLPDTHAGCVVEIGYRIRELLNASLPEVTEAMEIQRDAPVVSTDIEVRVPTKQTYHVTLKNNSTKDETTQENGRAIHKWHVDNLAAVEHLRGDPPGQLWTVWLGVSSLASWDDFATWYRRIAKDSDAVDDTVRKTAADLTAGAANRTEKIKRMFEFVSALRYVAIEIGVQGFRPHTPAQVLANRYGDCKDKANLLIAMLRSQKIEANFVLLNRGAATDVSFPSWQFNHAICYVPKPADVADAGEMWLDSTDSITPFGFVPPGDEGRQALVFGRARTEFKTISTTRGGVTLLDDAWDLQENPNGGWSGTFQRKATGLLEYQLRAELSGATPGQRSDFIYRVAGGLWPQGDFSAPSVSDVSVLGAPVEIHARATSTESKLPLPEFPWADDLNSPARNRPLWMNDGQPFAGTQTIRLHYSNGAPASLPEPLEIKTAGATLSITWSRVDDKTVERVAHAGLQKSIVPEADYAELRTALRRWRTAASK